MKCVVVGTEDVGKTCLVLVFQDNTFPTRDKDIPSVMDTVDVKVVMDKNSVTQLDVWDTAGQEEYETVRRYAYKDTDLFILCFSINNRETFEAVGDKWYVEIRRQMPVTPILLLGTKSDLRFSKKDGRIPCVSMTEAIKLAKRIGATAYAECSAKHHTNVDSVLKQAAKVGLKLKKTERKSLWAGLRDKMSQNYAALFQRTKTPDIACDDSDEPGSPIDNTIPCGQVISIPPLRPVIQIPKMAQPPDYFDSVPVANIERSRPTVMIPITIDQDSEDSEEEPEHVQKKILYEDITPTVLLKIFQFLSPSDLAKCCQIDRKNNEVAKRDELWAQHCLSLDPSFTLGESEDSAKLIYQILAHGWENDFKTEPEPVAPAPTKWFYFF